MRDPLLTAPEASALSAPPMPRPDGALNSETGKAFLQEGMGRIKQWHGAGAGGLAVAQAISGLHDTLLESLFNQFDHEYSHKYPRLDRSFCLIATGGYGRRELNPYSDVDLLFLHDYQINSYVESVTERILLLLYDLHLQVGHASRSINDCVKLANEDSTIRTSLLDHRCLVGSRALYEKFDFEIRQKVFLKNASRFLEDKRAEREARLQKFGHTVYLIEPDVKESQGGLRDLHLFRWIIKALTNLPNEDVALQRGGINARQHRQFKQSQDFLLRVRNDLHFARGKKNDRLTLDEQRRMSEAFGYREEHGSQPVEVFMRDYFAAAAGAKTLANDLLDRFTEEERRRSNRIFGLVLKRHVDRNFKRVSDRIGILDPRLFERDPLQMMRIFAASQSEKCPLDTFAREQIRANLHRVDDAFRSSPQAVAMFLGILDKVEGAASVLSEMNDLGFLTAWIPEFAKVHHRMQFDVYHLFTVDVHSIYAVEQFEKVWQGKDTDAGASLQLAAREIANRPLALLSILFHDIGKGHGGHHSERGAELALKIAARWGLSDEETRLLHFLVLHHLRLFDTALRRDIHDPKILRETADLLGDIQTLKLLAVLTYCDAYATNPAAYTKWKRMLVDELYHRLNEVFANRDSYLQNLVGTDERVEEIKTRIRSEYLPKDFPPAKVEEWFKLFPPRFYASTPPSQIARFIKEEEAFLAQPLYLVADSIADQGFIEVRFGHEDQPGIVNKLLGVMAANGMNVLGAFIQVRRDGRIFNVLYVTDIHYGIEVNAEKWRRIRSQLSDVLEGRRQVGDVLSRELVLKQTSATGQIQHRTQIRILNDVSDLHTVIEATGKDRIGLLFHLTAAIVRHRLTIDIAKIATLGQRVVDVFYVRTVEGRKLESPEEIEQLTRELEAVMDQPAAVS